MNKFLVLLIFVVTSLSYSQVPQGVSYQAIALNSAGSPISNSTVGVRLSIINGSTTGNVLYTETHVKSTNAQGLFNLTIGQGTSSLGIFSTINWGTGLKFLKVELDIAGGSNYTLYGTTQLLAVPYALAADSLITSPGEGITLLSPNGTPYQLTVTDSGQLSLPTSSAQNSIPNSLYAFGSFNNFNANEALLMQTATSGLGTLYGVKYFTAGSQVRFLASPDANAAIYGLNASSQLTTNGAAYTFNSTGFRLIQFRLNSTNTGLLSDWFFDAPSFSPQLIRTTTGGGSTVINATYNSATNVLSFNVNGVTTANNIGFQFFLADGESGSSTNFFGDDLVDGFIEAGGAPISFPNTTSTPKNYRVDLTLNFNGSGTYSITQLP